MSTEHTITGQTMTVGDVPEAFPDLPALADRLGVFKTTGHAPVILTMKNGDRYSLFELINAFLDHVDAATKAIDKPSEITPNQSGS